MGTHHADRAGLGTRVMSTFTRPFSKAATVSRIRSEWRGWWTAIKTGCRRPASGYPDPSFGETRVLVGWSTFCRPGCNRHGVKNAFHCDLTGGGHHVPMVGLRVTAGLSLVISCLGFVSAAKLPVRQRRQPLRAQVCLAREPA